MANRIKTSARQRRSRFSERARLRTPASPTLYLIAGRHTISAAPLSRHHCSAAATDDLRRRTSRRSSIERDYYTPRHNAHNSHYDFGLHDDFPDAYMHYLARSSKSHTTTCTRPARRRARPITYQAI